MYVFNLLLIGLLAGSLACSKGSDKEGSGEGPTVQADLKVMTYNVHHCNPPSRTDLIDPSAVANVIRKENPDLVALQEIDVFTERSGVALDQARELGKLTGMHSYFAKAIDYRGGAYGVAILSKYPILDSAAHLLPMQTGISGEQRVMAEVTVQLPNGRRVVFASTHFDTEEHRLVQAQKVHEVFQDESLPVILGGDFNEGPGSPSINYLDQHFKRTCGQGCSFTAPADKPAKAIDLLFFRPDVFQVLSHRVVADSYTSDHRPVVASLKFK